ncbi:MAG: hypothetical protein WDA60_09285 [Acidimicrobiia bacterium]
MALDDSLGEDAPMGTLKAYDRGYEARQVLQAGFAARLGADGSITDEDGSPEKPFRAPTNAIDAKTEPKIEQGIDKATSRIDKSVGLDRRAARLDVSDDALMALIMTALMLKGYSPDQIALDGIMAGGIVVDGTDAKIVDAKGKTVRPEGVEESEDTEEIKDQLDQLVGDILDVVAGLDPRAAATEPLGAQGPVFLKMWSTDRDGNEIEVDVAGELGIPKNGSLKHFLAGSADGTIKVQGSCSGSQRFSADGPVKFGLSGGLGADPAKLRLAMVDINLGGDLPSDCFGSLDLVEDVLRAQTFGPVEVPVDRGKLVKGRYNASFPMGEGEFSVELQVGRL